MAKARDDCRHDSVIIPNNVSGARVVTWLESDPGELTAEHAPIIAWRVWRDDPDQEPIPITPGMPLADDCSVWAVEHEGVWYFAGDAILHTDADGAMVYAKGAHERREQRRRQEREYQAQLRKRAA